jgi:hypothetical protein
MLDHTKWTFGGCGCVVSTAVGRMASKHVWMTSCAGDRPERLFWLRSTATTSRPCLRYGMSLRWLTETAFAVPVDHCNVVLEATIF